MADTGQGRPVMPHILGGRPVPSSLFLLSNAAQHGGIFRAFSVAPLAEEPFQISPPSLAALCCGFFPFAWPTV